MIKSGNDRFWNERRDLTIAEVAEILHVDRGTVGRYIRSGVLKAWVVNPRAKRKSYRVAYDDLEAFRELQAYMPRAKAERRPRKKPGKTWY